MVQIIGRLTGDAEIKTIGDKDVVNFTIAINDYYKPKGKDERIDQVTFVQCGYWFNVAIAASLRKGAVVEAGGRLFPTAYLKGNEPQGRINMQVQHVKVHVFAKKDEPQQERAQGGLFEENNQAEEDNTKNDKSGKAKSNKSKSGKAKPQSQQNLVGVGTAETSDDLPF